MVTHYGRLAHVVIAWVFVAGVLVQAFLAGSALSQLGGSGDFSTHIEFGYTWMGIIALVVLLTAFIGRFPRLHVGLVIGLFVLYVIQASLPGARSSAPAIAALHPVNAILLFGLGVIVAWRAMVIAGVTRPG
jgi:hypothetical protein